MEVVKLRQIKLAYAVRVDVENTVFKNDNYDLEIQDRFWVLITHRLTKKSVETTVNNIVFFNRQAEGEKVEVAELSEVDKLRLEAKRKEAAERKARQKAREEAASSSFSDAQLAEKRSELPSDKTHTTVAKPKKSNKSNSGV